MCLTTSILKSHHFFKKKNPRGKDVPTSARQKLLIKGTFRPSEERSRGYVVVVGPIFASRRKTALGRCVLTVFIYVSISTQDLNVALSAVRVRRSLLPRGSERPLGRLTPPFVPRPCASPSSQLGGDTDEEEEEEEGANRGTVAACGAAETSIIAAWRRRINGQPDPISSSEPSEPLLLQQLEPSGDPARKRGRRLSGRIMSDSSPRRLRRGQ